MPRFQAANANVPVLASAFHYMRYGKIGSFMKIGYGSTESEEGVTPWQNSCVIFSRVTVKDLVPAGRHPTQRTNQRTRVFGYLPECFAAVHRGLRMGFEIVGVNTIPRGCGQILLSASLDLWG